MVNRIAFTPVRHSHVITTFGPGALSVSELGVSMLTCGPRTWLRSYGPDRPSLAESIEDLTIRDSHMEHLLGVDRIVAPWPLSEDPIKKTEWFIPTVRFPLAEFCSNYQCKTMKWSSRGERQRGLCNVCASGRKRRYTLQVPIVLACPRGHLADIPWIEWAHDGLSCPDPALKYRQTASPRGPSIECVSCGTSRRLQYSDSFRCSGERPWLPGLEPQDCSEQARIIERTSTSLYFAETASNLAIPPIGSLNPILLRQLRSNRSLLPLRTVYMEDQSQVALQQIVKGCAVVGIVTTEKEVEVHLRALAIENNRIEGLDDNDMREHELEAMLELRERTTYGHGQPDLVVEPMSLDKYDMDGPISSFAAISRVTRLREVRVLRGFGRVNPPSTDLIVNEGYSQMWGAPRGRDDGLNNSGWLPGYEVFGEGILFVLDPKKVDEWLRRNRESSRLQSLKSQRPHFVLAHTLAHLIMRVAAPNAGYPLPSLSERLYEVSGKLGFLIYTIVGDIEGTLGGLVALAQPGRLEPLLLDAVRQAEWCTTDPVCIEDRPLKALSTTTSPGACHHCLLLPETSCERGNKALDRAVIVGTLGDSCGFLG